MDLRSFTSLAIALVACTPDVAPGGATAAGSSSSTGAGTSSAGEEPTGTGSTGTGSGATTGAMTGSTGAAPVCGDHVVDEGEECDYGETNSDAGACTHQCLLAQCGDGLVWPVLEECDFGEGNADVYGGCRPDCTWATRCGDGIVQDGHEECDLGDLNGTGTGPEGMASCTAGCRWLGRLVFVSSAKYTGDLGGLSGADLKCRNLAAAAGLADHLSFRAWLSDGVESPATRFGLVGLVGVPYVLRNGWIIADGFTELVEDGPRTGISITEKGEAVFEEPVWTNTSAFGEVFSTMNHCGAWTSEFAELGARRGINATAVEDGPVWDLWLSERLWTSQANYFCDQSYRLYCFEDGDGEG